MQDGHPGRELYDRLLRMMAWADQQLWSKLGTKIRKVYPEVCTGMRWYISNSIYSANSPSLRPNIPLRTVTAYTSR